MFGGGSSALRRGRMLSATPYSAALRNREREREKTRPQAPPTPATPTPTTDAMSSTARVILDTLDKMSTPIQVNFVFKRFFKKSKLMTFRMPEKSPFPALKSVK